jgi:spore germination protein GerM
MKKLLFLILVTLASCGKMYNYTYEVSYLDERKPDTILVKSRKPDTRVITHRQAVPVYFTRWYEEKYINVKQVKVIAKNDIQ